MVRTGSLVVGIGLAIVWVSGLWHHTAGWLTWLNGIAALCALGIATASTARTSALGGGAIALGAALFVAWLVGISDNAPSWLVWATFAFACISLIVGVAGVASDRSVPRAPRTT
jgi:hypothetical protein